MSEKKISKVFILAGGVGSRLSEQTRVIPKPLVEVGGDPVILHVMRTFYRAGIKDFYLLTGYKSNEFKRFFMDYRFNKRDVIFSKYGSHILDSNEVEDWTVHIVETGEEATTGQRVNHIRRFVEEDEHFFLTYGDSVSDVDIRKVEDLHFNQGEDNVVTITAVPVKERFGLLKVDEKTKVVERFSEKAANQEQLINGGYIACSPKLLNQVDDTTGDLSYQVLTRLAERKAMSYYYHDGFWHAMDTQKDVDDLNKLHREHPEYFGK